VSPTYGLGGGSLDLMQDLKESKYKFTTHDYLYVCPPACSIIIALFWVVSLHLCTPSVRNEVQVSGSLNVHSVQMD
jgi:hypothetical protein